MAFDGSTIQTATFGGVFTNNFTDTFSVGFNDVDMVALTLLAGTSYQIDIDNGTAGDLYLRVFDAFGNEVRANDDGFRTTDDVIYSLSPYVEFAANYSGTYYVAISATYLRSYDPFTTAGRASPEAPLSITAGTLTVSNSGTPLWPSANSIGSGIAPESLGDETDILREEDRSLRVVYFGGVDAPTDVDIARMDLAKGDVIVVDVNAFYGNGTVLRIFDDTGVQIGFDDDSGLGEEAELIFSAAAADDYYVAISGEGNATYNAIDGTGAVAGTVGTLEIIVHRNPTLIGTSFVQSLIGTENADYVVALAGADTVLGGEGRDTLAGGDDNDSLNGGTGSDVLYGEGGDDSLLGAQGRDVLSGGFGNDFLNAGAGNDIVEGGDGIDRLLGQAGNDTLRGDGRDDVLQGGDGDDVVFGGTGNDVFTDTAGNDNAFGDDGDDSLLLGIGNDTANGGTMNDTIGGGAGNDVLTGGSGNDSLNGGNEADRLSGGLGLDTLVGGAGDDAFVFHNTTDGLDLINDFALATDDRIDLSAIFAATGAVVTGANLAQFLQVTPAGAGADSFLGIDANGATGGLSFTIIAQVVGVTAVQLFDVNNFVL
jgi:Ca2+-binding RTX toxin-like protein